jgi:hypothetical protein
MGAWKEECRFNRKPWPATRKKLTISPQRRLLCRNPPHYREGIRSRSRASGEIRNALVRPTKIDPERSAGMHAAQGLRKRETGAFAPLPGFIEATSDSALTAASYAQPRKSRTIRIIGSGTPKSQRRTSGMRPLRERLWAGVVFMCSSFPSSCRERNPTQPSGFYAFDDNPASFRTEKGPDSHLACHQNLKFPNAVFGQQNHLEKPKISRKPYLTERSRMPYYKGRAEEETTIGCGFRGNEPNPQKTKNLSSFMRERLTPSLVLPRVRAYTFAVR